MGTLIEKEESDLENLGKEGQTKPRGAVPRSRQTPDEVPFVLTRRDLALLRDVWQFRLLTTSHLETLRRADPDQGLRFVSRLTLTRRLKGLFHHRFLRRLARPAALGSHDLVYLLDREGARALELDFAEKGEAVEVRAPVPSRLPKAQGLEHLLLLAQARVAFSCAAPYGNDLHKLQLLEWKLSDEARFRVQVPVANRHRPPQDIALLPDAGLLLRVTSDGKRARHAAFLEADRGTEPLAALVAKARAYYAYWQGGGFARDYGAPPGTGFWVLLTAPSRARAATLIKALQGVEGGQTMFRIVLESELLPERIGEAVWTEVSGGASVRPCQRTGR